MLLQLIRFYWKCVWTDACHIISEKGIIILINVALTKKEINCWRGGTQTQIAPMTLPSNTWTDN